MEMGMLASVSSYLWINIAKKMIPIHATSLDFTLSGLYRFPEITRASEIIFQR